MSERKDAILFKLADLRVFISRIFAVIIVLIVLFTSHTFEQETLVDTTFEISGLFLLSICSLGRLWSLMYLSGYKHDRLIIEGPYSMVRHPLYLFTLIGAVGIGLSSENILVLLLVIIFYIIYYPFTIIAEEKMIIRKFGPDCLEYMKRTPRFIPKLSLYKEPEKFEVKTTMFVKNFVDAMWFIWMFPVLHFIEMLQNEGVLPVLFRIP